MTEGGLETVIRIIADVHNSLPPLNSEQAFALNGLALLSIGLFISKPFISTKGGVPRDKDNNEIITTNKAVILVMAALAAIFVYTQFIEEVYKAAILSGYQAAGIFVICSIQYIISNTERNHTGLTKLLFLLGVFLLLGEAV